MIKLSVPDLGEEEIQEIRKVLESGWLVQGEKVYELENIVRSYLGTKHVLAVSNGTAALHLSLIALDIKPEDEVIVPGFTFPATANVVELVGARSVFVDIELETFNIDPLKIENKITPKTKAIIVVHEFGYPAKMEEIMNIARKYNLKVIEDAACALGSTYKDQKVGTIGDIGCFSLHPRKNITTGEGGLIATDNDEIAEKITMLRNHGIKIVNGKSSFELAGFNYRLTNIQGAIGVVQMKKLERIIKERQNIANIYKDRLRKTNWLKIPQEPTYGRHIWQTYHVLVDDKINRDELIKYLRENGIETNIGAYAVPTEPYYVRKYNYPLDEYKNSIKSAKSGLALPLHNKLKDEDIEYICKKLEEYK